MPFLIYYILSTLRQAVNIMLHRGWEGTSMKRNSVVPKVTYLKDRQQESIVFVLTFNSATMHAGMFTKLISLNFIYSGLSQ